MKTVFVLNIDSLLYEKEIAEVNSFYYSNCKNNENKVWVIYQNKKTLNEKIKTIAIKEITAIRVSNMYQTEEILTALQQVYNSRKAEILVFPSDFFGTELAVRLACRIGGSSCVGVVSCNQEDKNFFVEKRVYSNNLLGKFLMNDAPYCISISKIPACKYSEDVEHFVDNFNMTDYYEDNWSEDFEFIPDTEKRGLESAKFILSVGNGIGSRENVKKLEEIAVLIGAEFGASRPVVMNAWTDMGRLIGASGFILSPELCISVATSGAAAYIVGISNSKCIIAINNDEHAPIFKSADVAIVDDYKEIFKELSDIVINNI